MPLTEPIAQDARQRYAWGALLATLLIAYGSLYPFVFHAGRLGDAFATLLGSHDMHDQPLPGLVANIALYMPFGLLICCAIRPQPALPGWLVAAGAGALLSLSMETAQYFVAGRMTTLTDVWPNLFGALLGGVSATTCRRALAAISGVSPRLRAEPVAWLLLALFLAYRLYPYVPTLDLHAWFVAARPAVAFDNLAFVRVARYITLWWVVGVLIRQLVGRDHSRIGLPAAIAVILTAKIVIGRTPLTADEVIGVAAALALWPALTRLPSSALAALIMLALGGVVLADRLWPFAWQATGQPFGWLPFESIMHGQMAINTQSMAEKAFLYGSLIWVAHRADAPLWLAGSVVAAGLLGTSLLATHLSGHSAETTDAVIALLMTGLFRLMNGSTPPDARRGVPSDVRQTPSPGDRRSHPAPRPR